LSDLERTRPQRGDPRTSPEYPQYALLGRAAQPLFQFGTQATRYVIQKGIEAGLAAFAWLSARNSRKRQAIIVFRAREYVTDKRGLIILEDVRELDRETVATKVCTRLGDVETLVDHALRQTPRSAGQGNAAYGSKLHKALADEIEALGNPDKLAPRNVI